MTKIDFHILPTDDSTATYHYIARLVHKARGKDHRVLVAVEDDEQSTSVSESLWSALPETFLAHTLVGEPDVGLQISKTNDCAGHHDVLINLRSTPPEFFSRFERVIEVVNQQPDRLQASRQRYKHYQDNGYQLNRHDLRSRSAG